MTSRRQAVGIVIVAVVVMLGMTGCQVHTKVAIWAAPNGTGAVTVTVTLDHAAVTALGGQAALAAQLQDADLVAAGWTVTGPAAGTGSTTVIGASHPFATLAEASQLVEEVAGSGSAGSRPFAVTLTEQHSFWHTDIVLSGRVDLTCGVNCFGDAGLGSALGARTGVDPGPLISAAGQQPNQVFSFSVNADLPGKVQSTNAASHQGTTLQWNPQLGHVLVLSASTRTWNRGRIITFIAVGGALVLVLLGLMVFWLVRRRRRRRKRRGQHVKGTRAEEAVAPHP